MRGIEFFRNVSIGQYFPGGSIAHRLGPATKYLWLLSLMVPGATAGIAGVALVLALSLRAGALAGIKPGFLLRGLKPALPFFLLALLLQFLFGFAEDGSATLFVFARAEHGSRMPLAVLRKQVKDLPTTFTLDDSNAMSPSMTISSTPSVVVGARVSKSGTAIPQSGDLEGESLPVSAGASGLNVVIDRAVP